MHIRVHIEVNENGYAYTGMPNGEQNIDVEISDELSTAIDISDMLHTAVRIAIRDYKKAVSEKPNEEVEQ